MTLKFSPKSRARIGDEAEQTEERARVQRVHPLPARMPSDVATLRAAVNVLESWGYEKWGVGVAHIADKIEGAVKEARAQQKKKKEG
jgi:hypothetical protein